MRYFLFSEFYFSPSCFGLSQGQWDTQKSVPRDGTTAQLFSLDQPGSLNLLNSGRHPAWAVLTTGTAWVRGDTAFRVFCWLEVADFDLVFLFFLFVYLCFVFHVTFHLFVVCCLLRERCDFWPFTGVLRKRLRSLTRKVCPSVLKSLNRCPLRQGYGGPTKR